MNHYSLAGLTFALSLFLLTIGPFPAFPQENPDRKPQAKTASSSEDYNTYIELSGKKSLSKEQRVKYAKLAIKGAKQENDASKISNALRTYSQLLIEIQEYSNALQTLTEAYTLVQQQNTTEHSIHHELLELFILRQ